MTGENGVPETPDWRGEARPSPFDHDCRGFEPRQPDMPDCWLGEN